MPWTVFVLKKNLDTGQCNSLISRKRSQKAEIRSYLRSSDLGEVVPDSWPLFRPQGSSMGTSLLEWSPSNCISHYVKTGVQMADFIGEWQPEGGAW